QLLVRRRQSLSQLGDPLVEIVDPRGPQPFEDELLLKETRRRLPLLHGVEENLAAGRGTGQRGGNDDRSAIRSILQDIASIKLGVAVRRSREGDGNTLDQCLGSCGIR